MAHQIVEKTEKVEAGTPLSIRLSRIERFEGQPRRFFSDAGIAALADSIQADGQEQPIKVTKDSNVAGKFILIDGERRFRAFKLIHERTGKEPTINAFVEVVHNMKQHFKKSVVANLHREDLTPLDEAAAYCQLHKDGESIENLMKITGKSRSHVSNYMHLHYLPEEVKALMDPNLPRDDQLSVTQAVYIAMGIPENSVALRIQVAKESVVRNLGVAETRSLVEIKTGTQGLRLGGRLRKPSDDYKQFAIFLGRTRNQLRRYLDSVDFPELYMHRADEKDDRKKDLVMVDAIIKQCELLRAEITKK